MSDTPTNEGNTNVPNLKEALSIGAEAIKQLLDGVPTSKIIDNLDVDENYLGTLADAMARMGSESNGNMAVVLSDGETFTGAYRCKVVLWDGDVDKLEETLADGEEQILFEF